MALVQSKQGITSGSGAFALTITLDNPTGAGHGLIVIAATSGTSTNNTVSSVTLGGVADNFPATARATAGTSTDAGIVTAWDDLNCASGQTSVVVNSTGGTGTTPYVLAAAVFEFDDLLTSSAFDVSAGAVHTSSSTWDSTATATTAQANEVFVGMMFDAKGTQPTVTGPGSPWANLAQQNVSYSGGAFIGSAMAGWQWAGATGTARYNGTLNAADTGDTTLVTTWKVTDAPPSPAVRPHTGGKQWRRQRRHRQRWLPIPDVAGAQATNAPAGFAESLVTAPNATADVRPTSGAASSTATAPSALASVKPNASPATSVVVAPSPVAAIQANAAVAASAVSAPAPTPAVQVFAGVATVAAAAPGATVSTAPAVSAPAGAATVNAVATSATVADTATAGVATVSAVAVPPVPVVTATAGVATATATALPPVTGVAARAGVAAVSAVATAATAADTTTAGAGIVGAVAPNATVSTSGSTNAPAGVAIVSAVAAVSVPAVGAFAGVAAVQAVALTTAGRQVAATVAAVQAAARAPVPAGAALTQAATVLAVAPAATGHAVGAFNVARSTPTVADPSDGTATVTQQVT